MTESTTPPLIILVHGIRDIARWQAEIAATLESCGFMVELTNYGRMNLIEFLLPIPFFRNRAVNIVWRQLQHAMMLHRAQSVSIIAHSFGTFVVATILKRQFNFKVDHIIFCGSVLPYNFAFEQINDRFNSPVLNEVGTKDVWPAVAESLTSGYGSAGTYGFRRPGVRDRFHNDAGHSFFLTSKFCRKFWVPFLSGGTIVPGDAHARLPPLWARLLSVFKLKYFLGVGTLTAALFIVLRALWGPESYAYDFNASGDKFVYWNAPIEQLVRDVGKRCWLPKLLCESRTLARWIADRDFNSIDTFDDDLREVVSCGGFRYPEPRGATTSDPNLALRALVARYPRCIDLNASPDGGHISVSAPHIQLPSISRRGEKPAYLCDCDAGAVTEYRSKAK